MEPTGKAPIPWVIVGWTKSVLAMLGFKKSRGAKVSDDKGIQSERTALRIGWSGKAFLMSAFTDNDLVPVLWDGKR